MLQQICKLFCVGILASSLYSLTGCGGSSPSPSVAVTASATTVDGTDTATLTAAVTNDKNAAGVTWSVSGGGALSNTTTTSATYTAPAATSSAQTATITATSVADPTATPGTATITVPAAPAITSLTAAQQSVAVGTAYSVTLAGTGGISPYTSWKLAAGSAPLPPCLSLNASTGVLSSPSVPTAACVGVYSGIIFTMTDSGTATALTATSSAQTITVTGPTLSFPASLSPSSVTVGSLYSASAAATGTLGTTTYSIASGSLPASGDLVLNPGNGMISGTPKYGDAGTYSFKVAVVDAYGDTQTSGTLSITVNAAPAIAFGAAPSLTATDGVKYSSAVTASGGAGALTYALLAAGSSNLPSDFALNSSTGAVSGTPANLSSFTFEVQASDAYSDPVATQSYTVTVSVGAASKLVFTAEPPSSGTAGAPFGAVVQVEDANGFLVASSTASVTIGTTTTVAGTATVNAVGGVATFANLLLDKTGTYTLTAASTGLTSANSTSIAIGAATATQLAFTTEPSSSGTAGTAFGAVVQVQDAYGNLVTTSTASVTISTTTTVSGTASVNAVGGVATFTDLIIDTSGSYVLTAASAGLTSANSTSIAIGAGAANKLVFTTNPPASTTDGAAFGAVVQIQDANGNLVNSSASVTISTTTTVSGTASVNAVGGVATFTNLIIDTPGAYTLTASSGTLTGATSTGITINLGPASKLVFTTEPPATGTAGTAFTATVQIQDAGGNLITTSNASVTIGSSPTGVSGTLTVSASGGIATFTNLILDKTGTYTLTATSGALTPATSTSLTIGAGTATQLVFTGEPPSSAAAGTAFSATVTVEDANGNTVTTSNASVTIGSLPTGVSGTLTAIPVNGVASFTNLILSTINTYQLTASATGLPTVDSTNVVVSSGPAAKLVFTGEPPATGTAGTAFTATVQVQDASGNLVTSSNASVTVSSTATGVSGTLTVPASGGIATFSNLILDTSGSYTLTAASGTLTSGTSTGITIGAATANKLAFKTEPPSSGTAGTAFTATVQVQDAYGNLIGASTASVSITSTASGVTGTTTVSAVGGIASFTNLILDTTGTYTLTAASTGLASGTSTGITIGAATANKVVFTSGPPASGTAGTAFGATVQVEDTYGNLITSSTAPVTISTTTTVSGTATMNASGGIAAFTNLVINAAGGPYTLTAGSNGLTSGTSTGITISAGTATKLVITSQPPATGTAGSPFGLVVQVEDANNNLVTSSNASVTISSNSSTSGSVSGTLAASASGGVATFTNLILDTSGSYTLTATSGTLTNATSSSITIGAGTATQLAFFTEPPSNDSTGTAFGAVVQVQDMYGNLVTSSNASVTISSTPTGVSGDTTVSASGGVATFTNLILSSTGSFTLTASSGALANATSSSITVSTLGQISGQFNLQNYCGNGGTLPVTFTVTLTNTSTSAIIPGTTNSSGQFSFSSVPSGTYNITPSITGATSSLFYPTSYPNVVVTNGTNLTSENFNAQVAFNVSGTVSYSGSQSGQTYLTLNGGCSNGNGSLGTTIAATNGNGSYTIHGVQPGNYTLSAWMDPLGNATQNAIDPAGSTSSGSVSVTNAVVTSGADVAMTDPTFATPYENPTIQGIVPNSQGVLIEFSPSQKNGNGIEDANQYVVQWSTSPTLGGGTGGGQFATISGSHTFKANGDNGVWVLDNATLAGSGYSLTPGTTYYFQARSFNTLDTANPHPTGWCNYTSSGCSGTSGFTGVTVGTPTCTGTCTTVSGTVTIPTGLTCPTDNSVHICPGAPLYLGLLLLPPGSKGPSAIYALETASPVVGANSFTIKVPSGSNYAIFGILDQLNTGGFGAGAVTNVRQNVTGNLTISGSSQNVGNITLPATNSVATVSTNYSSYTCQNCIPATQTSYQLNFEVDESNRLPVAVTLTSGPNVLEPIDMSSNCNNCGSNSFQYSALLPGGAPKVGDSYSFAVTYSDGATDTVTGAVTAFGSTGAVVGPSDLPTLNSPASGTTAASDTPTFTWTDPTLTNPTSYFYSFDLYPQSPCGSGNCTIWQIPGSNVESNGFTDAITTITWGTDPTNPSPANPPSVSSLTSTDSYNWNIQVSDGSRNNGGRPNQASASVWFVAP